MAIEQEPAAPYERSAWEVQPCRVDAYADYAWYTVSAGDSLESIAIAHGITWQELTDFNWGTSVPAEINWYLRAHSGCTKQTSDGNNYVFAGGERVWVPLLVSEPPDDGECPADPAPGWPSGVVYKYGDGYDLIWDRDISRITVVMKLKWNFDSSVPAADQTQVKSRFSSAVSRYWNTQAYRLEATTAPYASQYDVSRQYESSDACSTLDSHLPPPIEIHFEVREVTSGEHWYVNVTSENIREFVDSIFESINVDTGTDEWVFAHEFGHAFDLPDEYDALKFGGEWCRARHGGPFEWTCGENWNNDDRYFADEKALMNIGWVNGVCYAELRARYFFHLRDWVNEETNYDYLVQVRPLTPADIAAGDDARDAVAPTGTGV